MKGFQLLYCCSKFTPKEVKFVIYFKKARPKTEWADEPTEEHWLAISDNTMVNVTIKLTCNEFC